MQVRIIATSAQQKSPVALLLKGELIQKLKVTKTQMSAYIDDGMPHYLIGNEYRFLESEIRTWLKTYRPSQERLESEFRDKKGRTLEEYVTDEIIVETLRITKEKLVGLCKKDMPFEKVGEKNFFHVQDILDYYRQGAATKMEEKQVQSSKIATKGKKTQSPKATSTENSIKSFLMPLCQKIPQDVPFFIVDGSYSSKKHQAGTGLVLVENWETVTGISSVWNIKTAKSNVSEFLAVLVALRIIKKKNMNKAVIVTDHEHLTKGKSIDSNKYEVDTGPYIKELNELRKELQSKVDIKFVNELKERNKNALHKKAHKLSQQYKTNTYQRLEI
ncbi:reverse transcriptase-like protein [Neobacillus drentensis]|uniref:reverse transcriptase-like protein n=1 Tax=Neobacillus drentensis TaxID=220684 RepID=UPI002FFF3AC7